MISKVRTYIKSAIANVDSDLREINSAFDLDVPENITNDSYFIKYDVTSIEEGQGIIDNNIALSIKFYFDALRDGINAYDDAMDKVNLILLNASNIKNIEAFSLTDDNKIYKVYPLSQVAESLPENSRQIVIIAEFEMGINQAICN